MVATRVEDTTACYNNIIVSATGLLKSFDAQTHKTTIEDTRITNIIVNDCARPVYS